MKRYVYNVLYHYLSVYIYPKDKVLEINPKHNLLGEKFSKEGRGYSVLSSNKLKQAKSTVVSAKHIFLNGVFNQVSDIQEILDNIQRPCHSDACLVAIYYNSLWRPLFYLCSLVNLLPTIKVMNWVAPEDMDTLLYNSDFEIIRSDKRILLPTWVPIISYILNRYIAPLPFFNHFCLLNIAFARPVKRKYERQKKNDSVSIVVAARNEAGNIEELVKRLPKMGMRDELIFVEGGSRDDTWKVIQKVAHKSRASKKISIRCAQQTGKGKGDAVRLGFSMAKNDILMILDADMTVPPETLLRFYNLISNGYGDFINGNRLIYSMEDEAMRFFNILGNKFFAVGFSFVLGQYLKDTLCGTKVISRQHYQKLAANRNYFGKIDPFGDFDLILGAARMNLKIVELPVHYKKRRYGTTNISRWSHGLLLLRMLLLASRKIKFV